MAVRIQTSSGAIPDRLPQWKTNQIGYVHVEVLPQRLLRTTTQAKNDPYNPPCYSFPIKGHAHSTEKEPNIWHDDIAGWGSHSRPHRLLLGQAAPSYRWIQVKMIIPHRHSISNRS